MSSFAAILSRHRFTQLRPGENDKTFEFVGAGICVLTLEIEKDGERIYRPLVAYEAADALEVSKRLLRQHHEEREQGYLLCLLGHVSPERAERLAVLVEISAHCKTGTDEGA